MDNFEAFKTLLETIVLILSISVQYPSLGIVSILVLLFLLLTENRNNK